MQTAFRQFLVASTWFVLMCSETYAAAIPRLEPFRSIPPTYNDLGFDVSYDSQLFPSLEDALKDCREGRVGPADCVAKPVYSISGLDFLSLVSRWREEGLSMMASELLARDAENGKVWNLFRVAIDENFGTTDHIEPFASPVGMLLRIPVRLSGTGAFNQHFHFLWRDGVLEEIDTQGWLRTLRLPLGHGIWKGVVIDPQTFTAHSPVWRDNDGNCCPSGGEVEVKLILQGRALAIQSQEYHPPRPEEPPRGR
jgi:hypothetical protein